MAEALRVGYVHVGPPDHGVTRYGRLLAAAARHCPSLEVAETGVELTGDRRADRARLRRAAEELGDVDLIHLQYNHHLDRSIWGPRWAQFRNLRTVTAGARLPLLATVHDMYDRPRWPGLRSFVRLRFRMATRRTLKRLVQRSRAPARVAAVGVPDAERSAYADSFALWWLHRRARSVVVGSTEEARRIRAFLGGGRVRVVPLLVEQRTGLLPAEAAKAALGLSGRRVVTQVGFIHRRKGYDLLVGALHHLPADVTVVLAGGPAPDHEDYVHELQRAAAAEGGASRFRITGFLAERELELWLAATDLAVCPFASVAASSSLSTWISVPRPILAAELPLVAEYNRMAPGAIHTFAPYTPRALAGAIVELLARGSASSRDALTTLRQQLAPSAILEQHLAIYRELCGGAATSVPQGAEASR